MDSRKIALQYRLRHWAQVMHERSCSGLNVRQFCITNNIRENVYYYWQNRLREAACKQLLEIDEATVASAEKNLIKQD